ncbi:MAG: VWA domain-containing protein [Saprospiraceae bacterium]
MSGWLFSRYQPDDDARSPFERLLKLFQEILLHTSGDVSEALSWLTELDRQYGLTTPEYGMADFIQDLIDQGYIRSSDDPGRGMVPSARMEMEIRRKALDDIFSDLKQARPGGHQTRFSGKGDERLPETRPYQYGDRMDQIAAAESLRNAQIRSGIDDFTLTQDDLEVHETVYQAQTSTVLMIDISHSMILYGEDRITPAKKVALALAELITTRYPKDTLDIIVFGNDAWRVAIKDLPYLQVGPYHTNTVAGLELAMDILRKRRNPNKQIFMITDGKPTCIKKGKKYYKNSFGLDREIIRRTMHLATAARKVQIPITTFMIASDPMLVRFVDQFTRANAGKAFYAGLDHLGAFLFRDYKENKGRRS